MATPPRLTLATSSLLTRPIRPPDTRFFPNNVSDCDTIVLGVWEPVMLQPSSIPGRTDVGNDFTYSNKGSVLGTTLATNEKCDPMLWIMVTTGMADIVWNKFVSYNWTVMAMDTIDGNNAKKSVWHQPLNLFNWLDSKCIPGGNCKFQMKFRQKGQANEHIFVNSFVPITCKLPVMCPASNTILSQQSKLTHLSQTIAWFVTSPVISRFYGRRYVLTFAQDMVRKSGCTCNH